jgi:serine/threonine protein kinase
LLDGEELRAQLDEGTLPVRKAIEYAQQIAAGLAAAHEKNIVHRDLKPENLFITKDGRVKILDFGLAKLRPPRGVTAGSDVATAKQITSPRTVMGTVASMSPEQVRGQDLDHRSDIFGFGIILYEMLSGRRAFTGAIRAMITIRPGRPMAAKSPGAPIEMGLFRFTRSWRAASGRKSFGGNSSYAVTAAGDRFLFVTAREEAASLQFTVVTNWAAEAKK